MPIKFSTIEEIDFCLKTISSSYPIGGWKIEDRIKELKQLSLFMIEHFETLQQAMVLDFKVPLEAELELRTVQHEICKAIDNIREWTSPTQIRTGNSLAYSLDKISLEYQPRGIVLIIAPWNYPVDLLFEPLIASITSGCSAILKSSEIAPHTSQYISDFLPSYMNPSSLQIIQGGPSQTQRLLNWPNWNLIFYTGNSMVGRLVHEAASRTTTLCPTILELGGKSPVLVCESANLKIAAKRICFGKFFNAGQTCVAPDYVLLTDPSLMDEFIHFIKEAIKECYPTLGRDEYSRIVNRHHYDRLQRLLSMTKGQIWRSGEDCPSTLVMAPTLITISQNEDNSSIDSSMSDEIFGPILPIICTSSLKEGIEFIEKGNVPLAIYLFTEKKEDISLVSSQTRSGALTINDTMMHVFSGILPLGGLSHSGHGRYKGKWSLESFSHQRPIMQRNSSYMMEYVNSLTRTAPLSSSKVSLACKALFTFPRKGKHF